MLRSLKTVIAVFAIAVSIAATGFAQEHDHSAAQEPAKYAVGGKMPDYTLGTNQSGPNYVGTEHDYENENCRLMYRIYSYSNSPDTLKYIVAFADFDPNNNFEPTVPPFGIFDYETNTLILDNKNKNGENGPDGLIDEVVSGSDIDQHNMYSDHPYCGK